MIRDGQFLSVEGTQFILGDRPVRLVGVNASVLHGRQTRADAGRLFEEMAADGVRVARVWALGEGEGNEHWRRFVDFRVGPEEWVEASVVQLDRVVEAARANGVRLIIVLANRWSDRGGLPQYARWSGLEPRGRNLMPAELAAVLRSERARTLYWSHVERIVSRRNSISDRLYAEDPTIAAWELINELSSPTCAAQTAAIAWVREMASRVRRLDPNHLIGAGHIGYNSEQSLRFWEEIHRLPTISYADTHAYPQNMLDARSPAALGRWLDHRAAHANALGRPLLVGEIGIPRRDAFSPRTGWFHAFFESAERNGTDGILLWMYRPWQNRDDEHGIWPWGPHARSTQPVRALLHEWSKRWTDGGGLARAPAGDHPLGIDRIAPFVEGDFREMTLRTDPWAIAEGCTTTDPPWLQYALPWRTSHGGVRFQIEGATEGVVRVYFDGELGGTWSEGRFAPTRMAPQSEFVWLRLEAGDELGADLLARFTRLPIGNERMVFQFLRPAAHPVRDSDP